MRLIEPILSFEHALADYARQHTPTVEVRTAERPAPTPDSDLLDGLRSEDPAEREFVAEYLREYGDADTIAALMQALSDPDELVRAAAAESLGEIGQPDALPALRELLRDSSPVVRGAAARAAGRTGDRSAEPDLQAAAANDPSEDVRREAREAREALLAFDRVTPTSQPIPQPARVERTEGRIAFEGQHFEHRFDQPWHLPWLASKPGRVFENLAFRRCTFSHCSLSITDNPRRRSLVRNIRLVDCEAIDCHLDTPVVEDVEIDGLKIYGILHASGAVFKHVTVRGAIGGDIMVTDHDIHVARDRARVLAEANAAYYADVDWALDIREAEFEGGVDLRAVPGHLVRRDPATQVLITRNRALQGEWRRLDLSRTYWAEAIELFLLARTTSNVLVAPKRSRRFRPLFDGLQRLREAGVAEPD